MNQLHLEFLASPEWAEQLRRDLMPWLDAVGDLGDQVLEIGPGPGLTTDLLRERAERVTAVELDPDLARALAARMAGTNVTVVEADITASGLPDGAFTAAACFSMLHHMPTPADQDRMFAEVARLLVPGGVFVGLDSKDDEALRAAHADDTFTPVAPETLADRLDAVGLVDVRTDDLGLKFRFSARRVLG
jgi:SAM-dependent methyltransferase